MLDRLLMPWRKPAEKASTGIGVAWLSNEPHLSSLFGDSQSKARKAQEIGTSHRWIRAAERVISTSLGSVPWHLETDDDEAITDESDVTLVSIRDLIEKPYRPLPGEPLRPFPRTRSGLWGITSRHMGLCGYSFWYADAPNPFGIPAQLLYINPARLWPAGEKGTIMGWVLDKDARGGGVPLEAAQVLMFSLEEADEGWFPAGLVETAMTLTQITSSADRHAASTIGSGGRRPGVFAPSATAGVMPPEVFAQLEKELRATQENPGHWRRDMILRGPVEFTDRASTNEQLDLTALMNLARDDTLELWGVPRSQLGGSAPVGLNSGSTKSYDEAALWQKAIHPRLERMRETIQFQLLDPIALRINKVIELEIEEPTFDDDAPKYELASQALSQPLRNVERRALLGLDPFGNDELDNAVWMPMSIVALAAAPLTSETARVEPKLSRDQAETVGVLIRAGFRPEDALAAIGAPMIPHTGLTPVTLAEPIKARTLDALRPKLQRALLDFLAEQKREIVAKVKRSAAHVTAKPADTSTWWDGDKWNAALRKLLSPYAQAAADLAVSRTQAKLGSGKAGEAVDLLGSRVLTRLLASMGERITGINETTRQSVIDAIRSGVAEGEGPGTIGDRIEDLGSFGEYRGELIARTETARVQNEAAIGSYREYGVTHVRAIDGDDDPECAARNGQEFTVEEAESIEDHPNGTLDWVPIVEA